MLGIVVRMVQQAVANTPISASQGSGIRRVAMRGQEVRSEGEASPGRRKLLLAYFVALLIPGSFFVAGLDLTLLRTVLLLSVIPLGLSCIRGKAGPVTAADIFILLHCFWVFVAVVLNNGLGRIPFSGITFVEMFGGYLIGRMLVRSAADYRAFVTCMLVALVVLCPFAIMELLGGKNPLRFLLSFALKVPPLMWNGPRLGFSHRVQGPFDHAILFGLFCSLAVGNFLYVYRGRLLRLASVGLAIFMTMLALSSGPLLSVGIQLILASWDRIVRFLRSRWVMLVILGALGFALLHLMSRNGVLDLIIQNLTLAPESGDYRTYTWHYGTAEVLRHPIFGIGLRDWVRAAWMTDSSIDNFWLAMAMQNGLPGVGFLLLALGINFFRIMSRHGLSDEAARYRTGHLLPLLGLIIVLGTVYMWGSASIFVMTYIGAGSWFYTADLAPRPAPVPLPLVRDRAPSPPGAAPAGGRSVTAPDHAGGRGPAAAVRRSGLPRTRS